MRNWVVFCEVIITAACMNSHDPNDNGRKRNGDAFFTRWNNSDKESVQPLYAVTRADCKMTLPVYRGNLNKWIIAFSDAVLRMHFANIDHRLSSEIIWTNFSFIFGNYLHRFWNANRGYFSIAMRRAHFAGCNWLIVSWVSPPPPPPTFLPHPASPLSHKPPKTLTLPLMNYRHCEKRWQKRV